MRRINFNDSLKNKEETKNYTTSENTSVPISKKTSNFSKFRKQHFNFYKII